MQQSGGNKAGAVCCNLCYSLICLGFLIFGVVKLVNIEAGTKPTGLWVLVICMSCCFLCCCSAAILSKEDSSLSQEEQMEMALRSGGSFHKMYLQQLKKAPWKAVCGFSGVLSVIILGVLGMVNVLTNMPDRVALAAVIVGCSLLGYSILLIVFTLCASEKAFGGMDDDFPVSKPKVVIRGSHAPAFGTGHQTEADVDFALDQFEAAKRKREDEAMERRAQMDAERDAREAKAEAAREAAREEAAAAAAAAAAEDPEAAAANPEAP